MLSGYSLLRISGGNAKAFLQGQLTCDLESILPGKSTLAAHCNPQGRIISLFYLALYKDDYYLLLPKTMLELTTKALKKYAVFFNVTIGDASDHFNIKGSDLIPQSDADKIIIPVSPSHTRSYILEHHDHSQRHSIDFENQWKIKNITEKLPVIYPATSAKLLPQELDLETVGAVSYDKGCYTGQEIIARIHYRGNVKSGLYQAEIQSSVPVEAGAMIFTNETNHQRECGMVIESGLLKQHIFKALIIIPHADAGKKTLYLTKNDDIITIESRIKHD